MFILLARSLDDIGYHEAVLNLLERQLDTLLMRNSCTLTAALYTDILAYVLEYLIEKECEDDSYRVATNTGDCLVSEFLSKHKDQFWQKWQLTTKVCHRSRIEAGVDLQIAALARCLFLLDWQQCPPTYAASAAYRVLDDTKDLLTSPIVVLRAMPSRPKTREKLSWLYVLCHIGIVTRVPGLHDDAIVSQTYAMEQLITPSAYFWETDKLELLHDTIDSQTTGNLQYFDAALQLRGRLIAFDYVHAPLNSDVLHKLFQWIRTSRLAGQEHSVG